MFAAPALMAVPSSVLGGVAAAMTDAHSSLPWLPSLPSRPGAPRLPVPAAPPFAPVPTPVSPAHAFGEGSRHIPGSSLAVLLAAAGLACLFGRRFRLAAGIPSSSYYCSLIECPG
jgi:hypothetical protein